MKPPNIFMTGNWEDLIVSTFEIDKEILEPYLPKDTEIDFFKGRALMSMVAFTFSNVKFFGLKIPYHQKFGQINFRFYVKSKIDGTKGVVFIKEFAPKPLIATIANIFYNEPYFYRKIRLNKTTSANESTITYTYKNLKLQATSKQETYKLKQKSMEQFVVDRYIAFIKTYGKKTTQYKINHRPWDLYKVKAINTDKRVLNLLPGKFKNAKPISSCFVDGSNVTVERGISQEAMHNTSVKPTSIYH